MFTYNVIMYFSEMFSSFGKNGLQRFEKSIGVFYNIRRQFLFIVPTYIILYYLNLFIETFSRFSVSAENIFPPKV